MTFQWLSQQQCTSGDWQCVLNTRYTSKAALASDWERDPSWFTVVNQRDSTFHIRFTLTVRCPLLEDGARAGTQIVQYTTPWQGETRFYFSGPDDLHAYLTGLEQETRQKFFSWAIDQVLLYNCSGAPHEVTLPCNPPAIREPATGSCFSCVTAGEIPMVASDGHAICCTSNEAPYVDPQGIRHCVPRLRAAPPRPRPPPLRAAPCTLHAHRDAAGRCVCDVGFARDAQNRCVATVILPPERFPRLPSTPIYPVEADLVCIGQIVFRGTPGATTLARVQQAWALLGFTNRQCSNVLDRATGRTVTQCQIDISGKSQDVVNRVGQILFGSNLNFVCPVPTQTVPIPAPAPQCPPGQYYNPATRSCFSYVAGAPGQLGAEVALRGGQLYRGRYAVTAPFGCGQIPVSAFRSAFLQAFATALGGAPTFPADLVVFLDTGSLPAGWPDDRKDFATNPGECPIWWQARASTDVTLDDTAFSSVPGVRLVDYWEQPAGGLTPGIPQPPCQPGQVFDAAQNRCVAAPQPTCPPGTAFNTEFGVCVPQIQACGPGQIWWFYEALVDQPGGGGKCVPETCPRGTERNPSTGECLAPTAVGTCPPGFDYDEATELCIETGAALPPPIPPGPMPPAPIPPTVTPGIAPAAPKPSSTGAFVIGGLALAVVALAALAGRPGA